jgi:hypothetical protein
VVRPADLSLAGTKLGARTTLSNRYQGRFFGRGFYVQMIFADRKLAEILAALQHYGRGGAPPA